MKSLGKPFEAQIRKDWDATVKDGWLYRLKDLMTGYKNVVQVSDFIGYKKPELFLIEAKEHRGNTFPFSAFRQYNELIKYDNIPGLHPGVLLWFVDHDIEVWIPIQTFEKLKEDGKKSFHVNMIGGDEYESLVIPTKKLRVFLKADYSTLINYYNTESKL